ncbi:hypothetical protein FA95DRAFT_1607041 [Auriscalpium vulgare]|uniref:Uncharacterized protein n=1 Tax=Auriscalpium vulgare TaxID=40419 RepID=A0ACB8RQT2_9AGAM|nr:hypothetical protein FA95DRAFT_1607041 [Auriscalpium vulgare]
MYAPGVPENVVVFTAPQLFGFLFNWGLFGVLSAQTYYYSVHFPADKRRLKSLVYGLCFLETVQTCMITQSAFAKFGKGWGDLDELHNRGTMWFSVPFMSGLVSSTVQTFFALRIFVLTGSRLLHIGITSLAVMSGVAGIVGAFLSRSLAATDSEIQTKTFSVTLVWHIGNSLCDLIICGCMLAWYLHARRRSFLRETTDVVSQILRLSVASGLITAAVSAIGLTLFLVYKHNNFYMCPAIILGKLYSNCLLVLLNNRYRLTVNLRQTYVYDAEADFKRESGSVRLAHRDGTVSMPLTGPSINLAVARDPPADAISMVTLPKTPNPETDPEGSAGTGDEYKMQSYNGY